MSNDTIKLFIHGVPDSSTIWSPLVKQLADLGATIKTPDLPGFTAPPPIAFKATKEAYLDWLVGEVEALHKLNGPIDIIGHDWGAVLAQRAVCVRPELFRSWVVSNAVIDPNYQGHRLAKLWNTPIIGEIVMALSKPAKLKEGLIASGIPEEIAATEAEQWQAGYKKKCILKLYRSSNGLRFRNNWAQDLERMSPRGLLVWGENDPYVPLGIAQGFATERGIPLQVIRGAGHWAIAERPQEVAEALKSFWSQQDAAAENSDAKNGAPETI